MTIFNYYHLVFKKVIRRHLGIVTLKKKGVHGRDLIQIPDFVIRFTQPDHRKSKFGLRHRILSV